MSGTKEAGIKLTLDATGFSRGLKGAENEASKAGMTWGRALSKGMQGGLRGAGDAVKSALSGIKTALTAVFAIGGGVGFAELVRGAINAEAGFKRLAFAIRAGTGQFVSWTELARVAHKVALDTAQSSEKLGGVMEETFRETGSSDFAVKSIDQIGTVATATREPVETLGRVAGQIGKQFGVAGDHIGEALTAAFAASERGGVTLDEMAERLGVIGANAKEAGLTGTDGFQKMIGIMNLSKDALGNLRKGIPAVAGVFDTLGTAVERNKALMKLGIDPSTAKGDITKQIEAVLAKTKGDRDKLSLAFQGPQLQFLAELGKNYATTFKETAGDVKTKTTAANAAFEAALAKAGTSAVSYAEVQAEARENMKDGPEQMEIALEKLRQAFAKPEFTEAVTKLMGLMPKLADALASVVGFAVDHPVAAGATALAGVGAKGFLEGGVSALITAAFARGGTTAAASISGALATGGGTAGTSLAGAMLGAAAPFALAFGAAVVAGGYLRQKYDEYQDEKNKEGLDRVDYGKIGGKEHVEGEGVFNPETGEFERYEREGPMGDFKLKTSKTANAVGGGLAGIGDLLGNAVDQDQDPDSPLNKSKRAFMTPPPPTEKKDPGRSAADAKLLAQMLAATKLRVEVTNPEAIGRDAGGSGTGSPAPGRVPRP